MSDSPELSALLHEDRTFEPPAAFRERARVRDASIYEAAERDPEAFWAGFARELEWIRPWTQVLEWNPPHAKWFVGGTLNVSANCLDRHVRTSRRNKAAMIWEGEPGDRRTLTYFDLYRQVCAFANVLKSLGVRRGDRVALYLPLVPSSRSRCWRALESAPSTASSSVASAPRRCAIASTTRRPSVLITADGGYRRGQMVPLKQMADDALEGAPSIEHVVIVRRIGEAMTVDGSRKDAITGITSCGERAARRASLRRWTPRTCSTSSIRPARPGKPKGIVHTTGGYLVGAYATTQCVFDLRDEDVYWCTADIGWVTGHSYVVYGPLANGATVVMYEGAPDWPEKDRFWQIIERYGVTILLHRTRPRSAHS